MPNDPTESPCAFCELPFPATTAICPMCGWPRDGGTSDWACDPIPDPVVPTGGAAVPVPTKELVNA